MVLFSELRVTGTWLLLCQWGSTCQGHDTKSRASEAREFSECPQCESCRLDPPSPSRVIHCHLYDFILGALCSSFPSHLHCLLLCFKNEIDSPKQLWILDRFQTYISVKLAILARPRRSPNFDYSFISFAFSQRSSYHWLYILNGAWKGSDIMTVHIETYK